jgi:5,10-methylenetetrahydrofolate reductase
VPGVHIPDEIIERLKQAESPKAEGKKICVELIQQIREIPGVAGVHVMAYRQEEFVTEIILDSGVLKHRIIDQVAAARFDALGRRHWKDIPA